MGRGRMLFGKKERAIIRLLIVEDEPLVAFDTEYFLTDANFEIVATVDRVADAMVHLEGESDIHLILVDVNLTDGTGLDVAHAAALKQVPVMFVTGDLPEGAEAVAHGFLAKPYQQRALLRAIEVIDEVLRGKTPKKLPAGFKLFRTAEPPAKA